MTNETHADVGPEGEKPDPRSQPQPPRATPQRLRSQSWFDNPDNADMTALYIERTMNFGLSFDEL